MEVEFHFVHKDYTRRLIFILKNQDNQGPASRNQNLSGLSELGRQSLNNPRQTRYFLHSLLNCNKSALLNCNKSATVQQTGFQNSKLLWRVNKKLFTRTKYFLSEVYQYLNF